MKKLIAFISIVVMLLVNCASAETFSLHSGVEFGMTMEEVKSAEEGAGCSVSTGNQEISVKTEYLGGIAGGYINYYFSTNGNLNKCRYQFGNAGDYYTLQEMYSGKYGAPMATGDALKEISGESGCTSDALTDYQSCVADYTFNFGKIWSAIKMNGKCQWFVPVDDGSVVEIVLVSFERVGTYTWSANNVYYFYRTPEERVIM